MDKIVYHVAYALIIVLAVLLKVDVSNIMGCSCSWLAAQYIRDTKEEP